MAKERARTLEQASAVVFVLDALLPLLIVTWTFYRLNVVHDVRVQIGLGLAVGVSLVGFVLFRQMMKQVGETLRSIAHATSIDASAASRASRSSPTATTSASSRSARVVPGVGAVRELADANALVAETWRREAAHYVGETISISVINSTNPVVGRLIEVAEQGLRLEVGGAQIGVVYRRIGGIERGDG
jgi:hypothetical protein